MKATPEYIATLPLCYFGHCRDLLDEFGIDTPTAGQTRLIGAIAWLREHPQESKRLQRLLDRLERSSV